MFRVGDMICSWGPHHDPVMGRVLEVVLWPADWCNEEDERPVSHYVLEDFPLGRGVSYVFPKDYTELRLVEGDGLKPTQWRKIEGRWARQSGSDR